MPCVVAHGDAAEEDRQDGGQTQRLRSKVRQQAEQRQRQRLGAGGGPREQVPACKRRRGSVRHRLRKVKG